MKRIFTAVLTAVLLFSLCACSFGSGAVKEPVTFYYPRASTNFVYGAADGVLASEIREASGHTEDLRYLLAMHLRGPLDDDLKSPFPAGTTLLNVYPEESTLIVTISAALTELKDMDLTVACAAVAQTCFGLCDAETVQILAYTDTENADVDLTFARDSLLLTDDSTPEAETAEETQ